MTSVNSASASVFTPPGTPGPRKISGTRITGSYGVAFLSSML